MTTQKKKAKQTRKLLNPMSEHHKLLQVILADSNLPLPHRLTMLRELLTSGTPEAEAIALAILEKLAQKSADAVYYEKCRRLDSLLKEIQDGPMRSAIFVEMLPSNGSGVFQAFVLLDDGTEACTVIPKAEGQPELRLGDRVVLDGKGRVLLQRAVRPLKLGDVAQLERRIDDRHVEVSLRSGSERAVFLATQDLMDQIQAGQVSPGASLIVSTRRALALAAIPPQDGLAHYRFLDRGPVPEVRVEHIGAPPRCIEEVATHVRTELTQPEVRRRYKLRRCCMKLLCGVSGTGKSLSIAAIHRRLYEIMSEVTGVPLEQLPPRVFRLRQGQVLSMWLGESEKNWERAINEAEQLADEVFTTPDGRQLKLPVLLVLEEVDGLGRARGQEAIQDRILSTILQRLDPHQLELSDRLVIVLATTNVPQLVDPALIRRLGGSIENFGRLKRRSFMAVLDKLTDGLPAASNNGCTQREIWERHIQNLAAWFFSPNGSEPGLLELTYAGASTPVIKHRRDFLTGALVEGAVQQAAREASQAELNSASKAGITFEQLARAFDEQLRGIVDLLKEHNAGSYTDLPDGVRVATVRRIPQPGHLAIEFHRP
jgi:ATP-dependent 26S proteasome regulatory subunit